MRVRLPVSFVMFATIDRIAIVITYRSWPILADGSSLRTVYKRKFRSKAGHEQGCCREGLRGGLVLQLPQYLIFS